MGASFRPTAPFCSSEPRVVFLGNSAAEACVLLFSLASRAIKASIEATLMQRMPRMLPGLCTRMDLISPGVEEMVYERLAERVAARYLVGAQVSHVCKRALSVEEISEFAFLAWANFYQIRGNGSSLASHSRVSALLFLRHSTAPGAAWRGNDGTWSRFRSGLQGERF